MGTSKSLEFPVKDNRIARYAKALSHPARIGILNILLKKQTCTCGELVMELPLSQSTISQHLCALRDAGLVRKDVLRSVARYYIDEKEWELARKYIDGLFAAYQKMHVSCT